MKRFRQETLYELKSGLVFLKPFFPPQVSENILSFFKVIIYIENVAEIVDARIVVICLRST